jgi:hypothetical protein
MDPSEAPEHRACRKRTPEEHAAVQAAQLRVAMHRLSETISRAFAGITMWAPQPRDFIARDDHPRTGRLAVRPVPYDFGPPLPRVWLNNVTTSRPDSIADEVGP